MLILHYKVFYAQERGGATYETEERKVKFLSILLVICMICNMMSFPVIAAADTPEGTSVNTESIVQYNQEAPQEKSEVPQGTEPSHGR